MCLKYYSVYGNVAKAYLSQHLGLLQISTVFKYLDKKPGTNYLYTDPEDTTECGIWSGHRPFATCLAVF